MSKGRNQHVVPNGNNWAVRGAGNERTTRIVETQREAIQIAREISINQQSELFIHGRNGQIRERNTYGEDNCPPQG